MSWLCVTSQHCSIITAVPDQPLRTARWLGTPFLILVIFRKGLLALKDSCAGSDGTRQKEAHQLATAPDPIQLGTHHIGMCVNSQAGAGAVALCLPVIPTCKMTTSCYLTKYSCMNKDDIHTLTHKASRRTHTR